MTAPLYPSFRPVDDRGVITPEFLRWLEEIRGAEFAFQPGQISATLSSVEPSGWKFLNGQTLSKTTFADLYAVIGGTHGETATTFDLPDMQDHTLWGAGGTIALNALGGSDSLTLTTGQLPSHTHGVTDPGHTHAITDPGHTHTTGEVDTNGVGAGAAADGAVSGSSASATTGITVTSATTGVTVDATGSGDAIDITPASIGVNWMVKT